MISIRMFGLMLVLMLVSACSSSTMSGSWANPDHPGKIENVYIVGFTQDEFIRRMLEDAFGSQLINSGVNTASSYKNLPGNEEFNREEIIKTTAENGFDSVLFTNVTSQRSETVINSGFVYTGVRGFYGGRGYSGGSGYYGGPRYYGGPLVYGGPRYYGGFGYGSGYRRINSVIPKPSTGTEFTLYTVESALHDLQTGETIWSADFEVVDQVNIQKMVQDHVDVVTKELKDQGLI